jgi:serine/threonine protein phosphatase PrpC
MQVCRSPVPATPRTTTDGQSIIAAEMQRLGVNGQLLSANVPSSCGYPAVQSSPKAGLRQRVASDTPTVASEDDLKPGRRSPSTKAADQQAASKSASTASSSRRIPAIPTPARGKSPMQVHLVAGGFSTKGHKKAAPRTPNQDSHLILPLSPGKLLVGVFDGHGANGHLVSARVRGMLEQHSPELLSCLKASRSGASALAGLFTTMHETVVAEGLARFSGCTASVALIDLAKGVVTVAHAGDSTLMVALGSDVQFVSRDHKFDAEDRRRILARGGEVRDTTYEETQVTRVFTPGSEYPGLAMSRALGDGEAHALGVLSDPEIASVPFQAGSSLIVASDGLWDQMTASEAAHSLVKASSAGQDVPEAAQMLVAQGRARYKPGFDVDDITAVVVMAKSGSDQTARSKMNLVPGHC